jgi:prophage maintenance system killer protein
LKDVEFIAFELARKLMKYDEPIPDYTTRFPNILESCVAMPFIRFGGNDLYKGLIKKAGVLFYLMIKNHPFQNGNKRIAIATLLTFLYRNNKWLKADTKDLYNFTKLIAASPPEFKDQFIIVIEKYIQRYVQVCRHGK